MKGKKSNFHPKLMATPSKRLPQILVSPRQNWVGRQGRRWVCGSTIKIDIYSNWHSGLASPGIGHWPAPTLAGCQITPQPLASHFTMLEPTSDLAIASPAQSGQRRNVFAGTVETMERSRVSASVTCPGLPGLRVRGLYGSAECWQPASCRPRLRASCHWTSQGHGAGLSRLEAGLRWTPRHRGTLAGHLHQYIMQHFQNIWVSTSLLTLPQNFSILS